MAKIVTVVYYLVDAEQNVIYSKHTISGGGFYIRFNLNYTNSDGLTYQLLWKQPRSH